MSVQAHLESAAAFIAVAESGDSERVAYERAADEIIAAQQEDPTLSNAAIGRHVAKSKDWVRKLVQWRTSDDQDSRPFGGEVMRERREQSGARKIAREQPDEFAKAFEKAPPAAQQQIVERILSTPSPAARVVRKAAEDTENRMRREQIERAKEASLQSRAPTPLSQFFWRIIGRMGEWTRDLRTINEDLGSLDEAQVEKVIEAHRELILAAQANLLELEGAPTGVDQHSVIEGKVA